MKEHIDLQTKASLFLEQMNISGDAMIKMDHDIDEIPEEQIGSYYLHDVLVLFLNHIKNNYERG